MIIISARGNFTSPNRISKNLVAKSVDLLDPRPQNRNFMSEEDLIKVVKDKRIIFLVHGYNNSFEELCDTYHIIESRLNEFQIAYDTVIGFAWPGGSTALSFFAARQRAKKIRDMSGTLLRDIIINNAKSVDFMAHSLGCYLLLEYIKKAGLYKINNIYLMAAAIKDYKICTNGALYSPTKKCSGLFVFRSEQDDALWLFGTLGAPALGRTGPSDLQALYHTVRVVNCSNLPDPIKHGSYKRRAEIFNFINKYPTVSRIPSTEVPVV